MKRKVKSLKELEKMGFKDAQVHFLEEMKVNCGLEIELIENYGHLFYDGWVYTENFLEPIS